MPPTLLIHLKNIHKEENISKYMTLFQTIWYFWHLKRAKLIKEKQKRWFRFLRKAMSIYIYLYESIVDTLDLFVLSMLVNI